jgi:hypothetical protein
LMCKLLWNKSTLIVKFLFPKKDPPVGTNFRAFSTSQSSQSSGKIKSPSNQPRTSLQIRLLQKVQEIFRCLTFDAHGSSSQLLDW